MRPIGINGFGRIGKCIFLILLYHNDFCVSAINAPDFDIQKMDKYLKNDTVHKYSKDFSIEIVDNDNFKINGHVVHIFRDRDPKNISWNEYNIEIVVDATGAFLTEDKIRLHNTKFSIMTAPPKDKTPMFVYGANHTKYKGENHISNASCTTNAITPILRFLETNYRILDANFTTIHAATASQKVVDTAASKNRTSRSIFNNIIPHTTGASSSIGEIVPEVKNKIKGTSVRVPVNNVSLIDLNVRLEVLTTLDCIIEKMKKSPFIKVCYENLVSSDYITTTCPSIVDKNACMNLGDNQYKIMIWYDNEWSYANQVIKSIEMIDEYDKKDKYFIENINLNNKNVVMRVDFNVPMKDGLILSDYRVKSSIKTIKYILDSGANRIVLMSHLGRPKGNDTKFSLEPVVEILENYLDEKVCFLRDGISNISLSPLVPSFWSRPRRIFLLENLRFHREETEWKNMNKNQMAEFYNTVGELGNVYINDAFGSAHRDHFSINGFDYETKGYGYLIQKELKALKLITENPYKQKTLAIIGGGKMDDKLALLKNLSQKVDTIYITGGNINSIIKSKMESFIKDISSNKASIILMEDGLAANNLDDFPTLKDTYSLSKQGSECFFDIGLKSLNTLQKLISKHSIIFWNGTLGVVEDEKYSSGSELCVKMLQDSINNNPNQKIIIGGGDTGGFVEKFNHTFTHISTGGGASIEYISFNNLVGLEFFTH
tara:strand:+ start:9126 stop:11273 length:2148 start_codon:yes stop_codon:yes gene_type:complete